MLFRSDIVENGAFKTIHITLKYGANKNEKIITGLKRISKPGLRVYANKDELPKVLGGLGTAITGWLLAFSKFDQNLTTQPASCISMLHIMYLWVPFAICIIITFIMSRMNVEKANKELVSGRRLNG